MPDEIGEEEELAQRAANLGPAPPIPQPHGSGFSVPLPPLEVVRDLLHSWGKLVQGMLGTMMWASDSSSRDVQFEGISLLELRTAGASTGEGEGEEDASVVAVTVTYKLVYWDSPGTRGRFINDLNTKEQRCQKIGYMPKVYSKDISYLFRPAASETACPKETARILLHDLPIQTSRAKYMRNTLPQELGDYLRFIECLRDGYFLDACSSIGTDASLSFLLCFRGFIPYLVCGPGGQLWV